MIEQLEQNVIQWAEDKGIFEKATKAKQFDKTQEEVTELKEAVTKIDLLEEIDFSRSEQQGDALWSEANKELKDAIGDIIVTLAIQAKMNNTSLSECLEMAWNEIKNRQGKMINGQFVKNS